MPFQLQPSEVNAFLNLLFDFSKVVLAGIPKHDPTVSALDLTSPHPNHCSAWKDPKKHPAKSR